MRTLSHRGASALALMLIAVPTAHAAAQEPPPAPLEVATLFDLSGMAPVTGVCCKGDEVPAPRILAVFDGKDPDELDRPRIGVTSIRPGALGVTWQPLAIDWPDDGLGVPNDLESATAIPGTSLFLVAESGDDADVYARLFVLELAMDVPDRGRLVEVADWPVPIVNVEGMAVARVGETLVFVYAERADGSASTAIRWAPMTLDPLAFGDFSEVVFTSPAAQGPGDRPVSAIEIAADGRIFVASAHDPGGDAGPFRSTVWRIGSIAPDDGPRVVLTETPTLVATLDGMKAESLALVVAPDGTETLYVGTDDEDFGGALRPLPER